MAEERVIDWDAIEREYSLGIRSNTSIASQFSVSEGAIRKRAKQFGWAKDLSAKIRLKAQDKVRKAEYENSTNFRTAERDSIEAAATMQANITLEHRSDIKKHKRLRDALLQECIGQTEEFESYETLAEILSSEDTDKMQAAFRKAISLPQRIDGFKKLVESTKTLVGLEREAFGIADNSNGDANKESAQDWLSKMSGNVIGVSK